MSSTTGTRQPCVGLLGRIFGHKFKMRLGDYEYSLNACKRCGMPFGGWMPRR